MLARPTKVTCKWVYTSFFRFITATSFFGLRDACGLHRVLDPGLPDFAPPFLAAEIFDLPWSQGRCYNGRSMDFQAKGRWLWEELYESTAQNPAHRGGSQNHACRPQKLAVDAKSHCVQCFFRSVERTDCRKRWVVARCQYVPQVSMCDIEPKSCRLKR